MEGGLLPDCEIFDILNFVGSDNSEGGESFGSTDISRPDEEDLLSLISSVIGEDPGSTNGAFALVTEESDSDGVLSSDTGGDQPATPLDQPDTRHFPEEANNLNSKNLCPVCHSPRQGSHLYYGGPVCVSCRGFFKRSVESDNFKLFECVQSTNNCSIDSKARKSCRWCRFQRCLSSGMKPVYVMTADERKDRLLKQIKGRKKSHGVIMRRNFRLSFQFTADEEFEIASTAKLLFDQCTDAYFKWCAGNSDHIKMFLSFGTGAMPMPGDLLSSLDKIDERAVKGFMFDLFEMKELCPYDRMTIIQENYKKIRAVFWLTCFQKNSIRDYRDQLWQYAQENLQDPAVSKVLHENHLIPPPVSNSDLEEVIAIEKWAPQVAKVPGHEGHLGVVSNLANWFISPGSDGSVIDKTKLFCLIFISLFSTAGLNLQEAKKVEELQNKYLWKLHRKLFSNDERNAARKLHEGLMLISFAENSHHQYLEKLIAIS